MEEKLPPTNGNGSHAHDAPPSQLPSAVAAPSGAPVSSAPLVAAPAAGALDVARDPVTGKILPGKTLNPKGRPPGIPNKNAEFLKLLSQRELREIWVLAKKQAKAGKNGLLEFLLDRAFLKQTPEAAGIVINNSPSASANASNFESYIEQLRIERAAMSRMGAEDLEG